MTETIILRNDSTGIADRSMYQQMLQNLKEQGIMVADNILTTELLKKIKYLHLSNVLELKGIEYCINMTTLVVANTEIEDITPVSSLTKLECLSLACNDIKEIDSIKSLINLKRLYLGHNMITDISAISGLVNLEKVSFRGNEIIDITPFAKLVNVKELSLEENEIIDISVLSQLVNLTSLNISDNDIEDICALENVYNMEYLYISYNDIEDISPLVGMMNLKKLDLAGNRISVEQVDEFLFQDFVLEEKWLSENGFITNETENEEDSEIEDNLLIEKCKDLKAKFVERPLISREFDTEVLPNKKQAIIASAGALVAVTAISLLFKKKK